MRRPRRFDIELMAPPAAGAAADPSLGAALRRWCVEGAFEGAFEGPVAKSPVPWKALRAARVATEAGLDDIACTLDGSHELARRGRWRGWGWRLALLARECLSSGRSRAQDPWDAGWWRAGSLDAAAAFRPRRPTLLMVREAQAEAVPVLLGALSAGSAHFTEPVRVVVVSSTPIAGIEALNR